MGEIVILLDSNLTKACWQFHMQIALHDVSAYRTDLRTDYESCKHSDGDTEQLAEFNLQLDATSDMNWPVENILNLIQIGPH